MNPKPNLAHDETITIMPDQAAAILGRNGL